MQRWLWYIPIRGCEIGIGFLFLPYLGIMTKKKSKSTFVLLDPFTRYVCFPVPEILNFHDPGLGLLISYNAPRGKKTFPERTTRPKGSFKVILGPMFSVVTVTMIFSIESSTWIAYSLVVLLFFLPLALLSPPLQRQVVPVSEISVMEERSFSSALEGR